MADNSVSGTNHKPVSPPGMLSRSTGSIAVGFFYLLLKPTLDLSQRIKGFTCRIHNATGSFYLPRLGEGELLLRLSLEMLLPLGGLLGLRLLDTLLGPFLGGGVGDREYDEPDLPRLKRGPRPLLGEIDLERRGRRGGDRL